MPDFDRWGLLLINLGTPDSTEISDVRKYLRQFLSDPRVLDANVVSRQIVLNAFILPFRPRQSAEAYEKIWRPEGSPLLLYSEELAAAVSEQLGERAVVRYAMRYQSPSIASVMDEFRREGIDRLVVFPLFPHNASSSYGSALEEVYRVASSWWNVPAISVIAPYFDDPRFIEAFAARIREVSQEFEPEMVLMSFHGLPERHCVKGDESGGRHCLQSDTCCDRLVLANRQCYRAQCFKTARDLAATLELNEDRYAVSFQSRLGRDPWIQPYTDESVVRLAKQGVKRLAVACPAFVADCLETLEEIAIGLGEAFVEAGGDELRLVPSLNASKQWVDAVVSMTDEAIGSRRV